VRRLLPWALLALIGVGAGLGAALGQVNAPGIAAASPAQWVAGVLAAEEAWPQSPMWLGAIVWIWLTFILSLLLLPRVKGALVGYQWALRMHGFGGQETDAP